MWLCLPWIPKKVQEETGIFQTFFLDRTVAVASSDEKPYYYHLCGMNPWPPSSELYCRFRSTTPSKVYYLGLQPQWLFPFQAWPLLTVGQQWVGHFHTGLWQVRLGNHYQCLQHGMNNIHFSFERYDWNRILFHHSCWGSDKGGVCSALWNPTGQIIFKWSGSVYGTFMVTILCHFVAVLPM